MKILMHMTLTLTLLSYGLSGYAAPAAPPEQANTMEFAFFAATVPENALTETQERTATTRGFTGVIDGWTVNVSIETADGNPAAHSNWCALDPESLEFIVEMKRGGDGTMYIGVPYQGRLWSFAGMEAFPYRHETTMARTLGCRNMVW